MDAKGADGHQSHRCNQLERGRWGTTGGAGRLLRSALRPLSLAVSPLSARARSLGRRAVRTASAVGRPRSRSAARRSIIADWPAWLACVRRLYKVTTTTAARPERGLVHRRPSRRSLSAFGAHAAPLSHWSALDAADERTRSRAGC
uniref:Uncharacterized protein n=1 Tax=Plectus sambesii TaxID=2011161 RepID=A0A914VRM7_9BILA